MDAGIATKTLDGVIDALQQLRSTLAGEMPTEARPSELYGRYINAPVWPWFAAGLVVGALFVVMFIAAWTFGRT